MDIQSFKNIRCKDMRNIIRGIKEAAYNCADDMVKRACLEIWANMYEHQLEMWESGRFWDDPANVFIYEDIKHCSLSDYLSIANEFGGLEE